MPLCELPHPVHFLMGVDGGLIPPVVTVTLSDVMIRDVDVDSILAQYPDVDLTKARVGVRISTGASYGKQLAWESVTVPWPCPDITGGGGADSTIVNVDLSAGVTAVCRQATRCENRLRDALNDSGASGGNAFLQDGDGADDAFVFGEETTTAGKLQAYSDGVEMVKECMDRADASAARVSFTVPLAELAEHALRLGGAHAVGDYVNWWSTACSFTCAFLMSSTIFPDAVTLFEVTFSVAPAVANLYNAMLFSIDGGAALEDIIAVEAETSALAVYLGGHSPNSVNRQRRVIADGDAIAALLRAGSEMSVEVPVEMRVRRRASRCASIVTCNAFVAFPSKPSAAATKKQIQVVTKPKRRRMRATPQGLVSVANTDGGDDDDDTGADEAVGLSLPAQAKLEHALHVAAEEAVRLFSEAMIPIEHRLDALSRRLSYLEGFAVLRSATNQQHTPPRQRNPPRVIRAPL